MSNVAVIGAGGFVGLSLIESLILEGRSDIRAVVRNYRNMAGLCRFGTDLDVRLADAENSALLTEALAGVDTVVNLTTGPPSGIIQSTRSIYEACVSVGVRRFVHLSSAVIYGDVCVPVGDDDPPVARHWMPYARAKSMSELWLRERLNNDAIDIVVLRPGIVWGVRSPHTLQIAKALAGKTAYLVNDGKGIFNGIYITNLVRCIRTCCEYPQRVAGFYNVGDSELVTWFDFFDALGPPLGCDCSRLSRVRYDHFPWSSRALVDGIQSLPLVNELYHQLKAHVPDSLKARIRNYLEGMYCYERHATSYAVRVAVERELWHLQRVRYKLPIEKFQNTFQFINPISFTEGIQRTIAWLTTLGFIYRSVSTTA
jgi:nucleoside-diphosphate-sugar epimerase